MPQQQLAGNQKENVAPTIDNDTASQTQTAHSDTPVLTPLAETDNTSEAQKPGTRSYYRAVNAAKTAAAINTMCDGSSASSTGVEQLHVVADRLTLEDAPSSYQPAQQTLNEATAAAEASAVRVPLIVATPVVIRSRAAKPEPETPSAPILPGLIEPTTHEERVEREYHLKFMREALDMVSHSLVSNCIINLPFGTFAVYSY
jgi:hypothetical protein